ncbi:hypothetical protein L3X38_018874 [Prunus dulcis]|uniref:Reverse transcriptase RNase H-like domain-containing protein n=1 Tax=Prunus dulcis TaxID=3755 RepID=A0AAD4WCI9_PRUDU|nr:hypothetical protein L3X38_018874 [Prunus dulcis]
MVEYGLNYVSRQLKHHEKNYPTNDLELAAVVHALKTWRGYPYGKKFNVYYDHKSLKKANVVANALSRRPQSMLASLMLADRDLFRMMKVYGLEVRRDVDEARVEVGEAAEEWKLHSNGSLRYKDQIVVPRNQDIKEKIIDVANRTRFSMHPGSTKLYKDPKRMYYWRAMKREIARAQLVLGPDLIKKTTEKVRVIIEATGTKKSAPYLPQIMPWVDLPMQQDETYEEGPVSILAYETKRL